MSKRFKREDSAVYDPIIKIPKAPPKEIVIQKSLHSFFNVVSKVEAWKKLPSNKPKDLLRIYCWNVNGIRSIIDKAEFKLFIKHEDPEILCFNETKIDDMKLSREKIKEEFKSYPFQHWNCSKPPKLGYSGCAILSKFKPLAVHYDLGVDKHDKEGRTVSVEYDEFVLVVVYVPNSGKFLKRHGYRTKEWDPDLRAHLKKLVENSGKPVILCGDLNCAHKEIDISKPKLHVDGAGFTMEERANFKKLLDDGYIDTFRKLYPKLVKYSFWNAKKKARQVNEGWRLDYFLVSDKMFDAVIDSEILDQYYGSDHCPIKLSIDVTKIPRKTEMSADSCIAESMKADEKTTNKKDTDKEDLVKELFREELIKDVKKYNYSL